jgi:hypothetical protein
VKSVFRADGAIREAHVDSSSVADPDVVDCVVGQFRGTTFPPRQTGDLSDVTILYPIYFSP